MKATAKITKIRHKRNALLRRAVWVDAYEKELARPQWAYENTAYAQQRQETYAKSTADIVVMYSKGG